MNGWMKFVFEAFRSSDPGTAFDRLLENRQIEPWLPGFNQLATCRQNTATRKEGTVLQHVRLTWLYASAHAKALSEPECTLLAVSCLAHDVAKPECLQEGADGRITFSNHEAKAAERADDVAAWLNLERSDAEDLRWLLRTHGNAHRLLDATADVRKKYYAHPRFFLLAHLQRANALGSLRHDAAGKLTPRQVMFDRYFEDLTQLFRVEAAGRSQVQLVRQLSRFASDTARHAIPATRVLEVN